MARLLLVSRQQPATNNQQPITNNLLIGTDPTPSVSTLPPSSPLGEDTATPARGSRAGPRPPAPSGSTPRRPIHPPGRPASLAACRRRGRGGRAGRATPEAQRGRWPFPPCPCAKHGHASRPPARREKRRSR